MGCRVQCPSFAGHPGTSWRRSPCRRAPLRPWQIVQHCRCAGIIGDLAGRHEKWDCQIFCAGGRLPSSDDEPFTEDYGKLGFCLRPLARRWMICNGKPIASTTACSPVVSPPLERPMSSLSPPLCTRISRNFRDRAVDQDVFEVRCVAHGMEKNPTVTRPAA
jgi:hypothetical protein